jgi:hypothetical protein
MLLFYVQKPLSKWQAQYTRLRAQLAKVGWISQGFSVALSKDQYEWLREAIANWRQLQKTLDQMQQLSRKVLFQTLPHPKRRKPLNHRVLGIN